MIYVLCILLVVLGSIALIYNRFIRLDNMVKEAWSDVNVQLKRRYSLIPNLVETVKGHMKYEAKTLKEIVAARNTAMHQSTAAKKAESENQITESLHHLFAVAEQYPNLKSNEQFKELSSNLAEIENTLQVTRRYYNATVRDYNVALHSFPSNLVANCLNLKEKTYFEIADSEAKEIQIKFDEK